MDLKEPYMSRRGLLKTLGVATGGIAISQWLGPDVMMAQGLAAEKAIETFTGPGANPHWNSVGPYVAEPQKVPLILLTDRPVQLETPRHYFRTTFTPNEAFYVRWHLEGIPNAVDLKNWKLQVEGNVNKPTCAEPFRTDAEVQTSFARCGKSVLRQQPQSVATTRAGRSVGQWRHGKRDVDGSAAARASRYGRCKERLPAGAVPGP